MIDRSTSTEIARLADVTLSTRTLCEYIIDTQGIDYSNEERYRVKADWTVFRQEGEIRVHLTQLREVGARALYLIRTEDSASIWGDMYLCSSAGTTQQAIIIDNKRHTQFLTVSQTPLKPIISINQLLFAGITQF